MDEKPFFVDSRVISDLVKTFEALTEYLGWLLERQHLDAYEKLKPVVSKFNVIMLGILEGNVPEIGRVIDLINRFHHKLDEELAEANTIEEVERLQQIARQVYDAISNMKQKPTQEAATTKKKDEKG
jgi:hypothetical protein